MTKTEFINTLDFEAAKISIARKLGIKADELVIKNTRSGDFKIDLRNVAGKLSWIFSGSRAAMIITDKIKIREYKDEFSYDSTIMLVLKSGTGEYKQKIGKLTFNNNKFVFYTMNDIKNARKQKFDNDSIETELNEKAV